MGWISTKDRLPEKGEIVLLFLDDGEHAAMTTGMAYKSGVFEFDAAYEGMFCVGFETPRPIFLEEEHVTHWRELPKPPGVGGTKRPMQYCPRPQGTYTQGKRRQICKGGAPCLDR